MYKIQKHGLFSRRYLVCWSSEFISICSSAAGPVRAGPYQTWLLPLSIQVDHHRLHFGEKTRRLAMFFYRPKSGQLSTPSPQFSFESFLFNWNWRTNHVATIEEEKHMCKSPRAKVLHAGWRSPKHSSAVAVQCDASAVETLHASNRQE